MILYAFMTHTFITESVLNKNNVIKIQTIQAIFSLTLTFGKNSTLKVKEKIEIPEYLKR